MTFYWHCKQHFFFNCSSLVSTLLIDPIFFCMIIYEDTDFYPRNQESDFKSYRLGLRSIPELFFSYHSIWSLHQKTRHWEDLLEGSMKRDTRVRVKGGNWDWACEPGWRHLLVCPPQFWSFKLCYYGDRHLCYASITLRIWGRATVAAHQ